MQSIRRRWPSAVRAASRLPTKAIRPLAMTMEHGSCFVDAAAIRTLSRMTSGSLPRTTPPSQHPPSQLARGVHAEYAQPISVTGIAEQVPAMRVVVRAVTRRQVAGFAAFKFEEQFAFEDV
jgi:hypothetical protein